MARFYFIPEQRPEDPRPLPPHRLVEELRREAQEHAERAARRRAEGGDEDEKTDGR